jgi:glycosyltransferase involved in cell wall biosynthesis
MNEVQGYVPKEQRKKVLLLCDDIRMHSGIATMAREIVIGTAHRFNWVNLAAAINHPEQGQRFDLSNDTNNLRKITDSNVILYPFNGYGSPDAIRQMIEMEKPDAIMFFTDPRYWIWLFQIENEIRKKIPMVYLNIWDDYPAPIYNAPYYESCDALMAISKQTLNINKLVLGEKAKGKVLKYVPHGINADFFFPIDATSDKFQELQDFKKKHLKKDYEYVVLYNARNIRRKCTSDLILAYSQFCEKIGKEKAKKCVLFLHADPVDENGTDLPAVRDLFCDPEYVNVEICGLRFNVNEMNLMYNMSDVVTLISSNEGWGLSLTEGLMTGRMIIPNVTGGMQDQCRFEDEDGKWIDFDENFPSNHFGTYKKCGEWALPVFPSNISVVGSVPTPYIYDDRADFRDVANRLEECYELGKEERDRRGLAGRVWATSDEAMMTAENMSKNVIDSIEETLTTFKPSPKFTLTKVEPLERKAIRHRVIY